MRTRRGSSSRQSDSSTRPRSSARSRRSQELCRMEGRAPFGLREGGSGPVSRTGDRGGSAIDLAGRCRFQRQGWPGTSPRPTPRPCLRRSEPSLPGSSVHAHCRRRGLALFAVIRRTSSDCDWITSITDPRVVPRYRVVVGPRASTNRPSRSRPPRTPGANRGRGPRCRRRGSESPTQRSSPSPAMRSSATRASRASPRMPRDWAAAQRANTNARATRRAPGMAATATAATDRSQGRGAPGQRVVAEGGTNPPVGQAQGADVDRERDALRRVVDEGLDEVPEGSV